MGDYGLRISLDGNDVKTCTDLDCVVTSKYPLLKGSFAGALSGSILNGYVMTYTLAHGLGYIPMVNVAFDALSKYGSGRFYITPYFDVTLNAWIYAWAESDITNVYIKLRWYDDSYAIGGASRNYNFKYFIFIDKGNLN